VSRGLGDVYKRQELDVETLIKTTFAFDGSIIMCPQVLPRDLYNEVIDDIIEYIKPKIVDKPKYNYWIVCLQDLKNRETFQEKYPDWKEALQRGLENLKRVDKWRNNEGVIEKIFSANPKVLEWWKNANQKLI
jgi:hypothetical protein